MYLIYLLGYFLMHLARYTYSYVPQITCAAVTFVEAEILSQLNNLFIIKIIQVSFLIYDVGSMNRANG